MCGICGYYNFNGQPAEEEIIRKMCRVITYRGPDDEGRYIDRTFGMGMRRLSIIDLDSGHQPISNETGSIWTVFNGEIYNYLELTESLKQKGHVFKTKSDTEVIVHLYEEYGDLFVKHLRGMFAIALWDKNKQELLLARDHLGIKQVYFQKTADTFFFGSEIKCILETSHVQKQVNDVSLSHYLSFMYLPEDLTMFSGIEKLKPGHLLKVKADQISITEYWNLNTFSQSETNFADALSEFRRLLAESIKLHLRSDVPLGVFLSGGIDSSIITALAAQSTDKPVNTFTIGYGQEGSFYDEREYASLVAKTFKTNHHELIVNPNVEEAIEKLIGYFDEPFANSSAIPNYYIAQMMRREVKVALSGLGGDEIAGGYERILGMKVLLNYRKLPAPIKSMVMFAANVLPDSKRGNYLVGRTKRFASAAKLSPAEAYYSIISAISDQRKRKILAKLPAGPDSLKLFQEIIGRDKQDDILRKAIYFDLVSYMPNDLLVLTDRTSMANSLEVRVPLLDQRLVEFMFQLPMEYKVKGWDKKFIFKEAFKNILPREILNRKKRGFSTPLSVWLRNDLRHYVESIFTKQRINQTGMLDFESINELLAEHNARKANHQGVIFALLTFIIWHEKYVQNK
jgi:asparagine synthase (glutamine-hydrolysing)